MSRERKRYYAIRWARYFNHYGHMLSVGVGGEAAIRAMHISGQQWKYVRRQQKRKFKAERQ
jgi:hypothetical protein